MSTRARRAEFVGARRAAGCTYQGLCLLRPQREEQIQADEARDHEPHDDPEDRSLRIRSCKWHVPTRLLAGWWLPARRPSHTKPLRSLRALIALVGSVGLARQMEKSRT